MSMNDTCIMCGSPCFTMAIKQECSNPGCSNYVELEAPVFEIQDDPFACYPVGEWIDNAGEDWQTSNVYGKYIGKVIAGPPKGTTQCSVEMLQSMGIVGLYKA